MSSSIRRLFPYVIRQRFFNWFETPRVANQRASIAGIVGSQESDQPIAMTICFAPDLVSFQENVRHGQAQQ
jgi:hypothetical protein